MNKYQFDGKDIGFLVRKFGSPFLIFSEKQLEKNFTNLNKYFSSDYKKLRIDYSAKTNLEVGVLKILKRLGANLEISGPQELEVAKEAGFTSNQAVLDTPIKKEDEIKKLVKEGIHAFYADSFDDINRLQNVAGSLNKKIKVVIRINPGFDMAFLDIAERFLGKFGVHDNELPNLVDFMENNTPNLKLIGLSTHVGSQQVNTKNHIRALKKLFRLAVSLEELGYEIEELCIGGGYPSPTLNRKTTISLALSMFGYNLQNKPEPLSSFGNLISEEFARETKRLSSTPTLVIQPGRSLVSNSAIAVGRIMTVKDGWVFIDLSTSSLPESLFFGQRKVLHLGSSKSGESKKYNVAGRGLNTADNFVIGIPLGNPNVGDIVIVLDAGAYSISRANRFTILNPKVLLITNNGQIKQIRREETYEDILAPME